MQELTDPGGYRVDASTQSFKAVTQTPERRFVRFEGASQHTRKQDRGTDGRHRAGFWARVCSLTSLGLTRLRWVMSNCFTDTLSVMGSVGFGIVCGWLTGDGAVRAQAVSPPAAGLFGLAVLPAPAVAYLLSGGEAAAVSGGSVLAGIALSASWRALLVRLTAGNAPEGSSHG